MNKRYAIIILGLLFGIPFAQEANTSADVEGRQKAVLSALDSIEENVLGFSLNGRAKGGLLSSIMSSEDLPNGDDVSEYSAFSDFLLNISVRPSSETKATFDLRFHKDWQSAYREGNNSPIIRWWSYDGNILDKKLKFNLGTMRLAYTPLTIYLPEPSLIMEPEIFQSLKKEAMEERYLDGTNRRLLQGLNTEFRISAGIFDNIFAQGTLVRLHRTEKKEIAYDFNPDKDRYSTAARLGIETFGISFGVADVYTFDRVSSAKRKNSLDYEKNNVLSFELGYNSKKQFSPINFGIETEYALSNYSHNQDITVYSTKNTLILDRGEGDVYVGTLVHPGGLYLIPSNSPVKGGNYYPYYATVADSSYKIIGIEKYKNQGALLANAFVSYNQNPFEAKLSGRFFNTDRYFESELAASPAYLPNLPIFNSNADLSSSILERFRTGSLENMYYSLYYSLPMNAMTIVTGDAGDPAASNNSLLYNNYKFSQFYRNAYIQRTYTRLERFDAFASRLDPSVNLALPSGYATPDRTGADADLNLAWNKAVNIRGVFGTYSSEDGGNYSRFGGGLEVDAGRLAGLSKALVISGSYEQNKEEKGLYNPQTDRIMAGAKIGIWRGLSLTAGFQQLNKKFETPYEGLVDKTGEILAIGGPQIKISERAEFSLQGGLLSNSIEGNGVKLDLDKYIATGKVTVEF
jgi:hypothetical protein